MYIYIHVGKQGKRERQSERDEGGERERPCASVAAPDAHDIQPLPIRTQREIGRQRDRETDREREGGSERDIYSGREREIERSRDRERRGERGRGRERDLPPDPALRTLTTSSSGREECREAGPSRPPPPA
jgi:hypothetical protein